MHPSVNASPLAELPESSSPQGDAVEPTTAKRFDVELLSAGRDPGSVVTALRETTAVGLTPAQRLVRHVPQRVVGGLNRSEADRVHRLLTHAGAEARVVPHDARLLTASRRVAIPESRERGGGPGILLGSLLVAGAVGANEALALSESGLWAARGVGALGGLLLVAGLLAWWGGR